MAKKYLIYIDQFCSTSGGQVALHKLCHDLRALGEEAYVYTKSTHPKLNVSSIFEILPIRDPDKWVVIYPEIYVGNPLNAKNVVRWILNTPGQCGGSIEQFYKLLNEKDLIYKFSPFFKYDGIDNGILRTTFIDYDIFYNKKMERKYKECFLVKKGGINNIYHSNDAINLAQYQHDWEQASDILNQCERFFCYDNECFWVTLAALCGCISIVIPNKNINSDQWKESFPFNKYGIAFGMDEESYARETIHLVKDYCISVQTEDLKSVQKLIKDCEDL
jgi:hypothetical protein